MIKIKNTWFDTEAEVEIEIETSKNTTIVYVHGKISTPYILVPYMPMIHGISINGS